jgi:hypothetical protein
MITQRPGKLDQDVLSQCMTQFIMRIVNPIDQQTIASSVEGAGRRLLDELPALTKGQVIVSGVAINTPVLCQVRKRITRHGGETIDAPAQWQSYFTPTRDRRARNVVHHCSSNPSQRVAQSWRHRCLITADEATSVGHRIYSGIFRNDQTCNFRFYYADT